MGTEKTEFPDTHKKGLTVKQWPLDKIKPYGRNPRKVSDKAVEKVARSIREFGWQLRVTWLPCYICGACEEALDKTLENTLWRTHKVCFRG